jgi:hypothetical protein
MEHFIDKANFAVGSVGFRLRFFQKSHLYTRRSDEVFYGCPFCVFNGRTTEESDATVFYSQKDLCAHIARHPRPLPEVPGLTVIDAPRIPVEEQSSYDIHLKAPPLPSPLAGKREMISKLPTTTANQVTRRMHGMRTMPGGTPCFEMAAGARIVGIEFPEQFYGEWCMGYHDGAYAGFPLDVVRLEPPAVSEVPMGGSSSVSAVAKWKFNPKDKSGKGDKGDWLKFDRGDVITNIKCESSSSARHLKGRAL